MITYISSWARQVILSVVVAIILEMILSPNSKSTKYIKTVIGIYIVYTIIAPGLRLIGGKNLDFANIDYENYLTSSEIYQNLESNVSKMETDSFEETYKLNLKQDMENKLREKGFIVSNIKLEVDVEESSEQYGRIKQIEIKLSKKEEGKDDQNEISVNKITIGESSARTQGTEITEKEESEIKRFLSEEYGVDNKYIAII